jgi:hypothetical protein
MTTQTRLDAYLAAELAILQAQEVSSEGRAQKMAALADVRAQIDKLQAQVNREAAAAAGNGGLGYSLANLSGES